MTATIESLLRTAIDRLSETSPSARLDAEVLLADVLQTGRAHLVANPDKAVADAQAARFQQFVEERLAHVPIAYLTGKREFWSLELQVTRDTLVPRPDTEMLVERALSDIPADAPWSFLDMGTGTGAIAIALARERPNCVGTATDNSAAALAVAQANIDRHCPGSVEVVRSDWFDELSGRVFDLIISNPPYVVASPPDALTDPELAHEPPDALYSGKDGLNALRKIIEGAPAHLKQGGIIWLEHAPYQADAVRSMLLAAGFDPVEAHDDGEGRTLFTHGVSLSSGAT